MNGGLEESSKHSDRPILIPDKLGIDTEVSFCSDHRRLEKLDAEPGTQADLILQSFYRKKFKVIFWYADIFGKRQSKSLRRDHKKELSTRF